MPVDITDPKLVRAFAHPLRIQILGLLDNRTASPSELAAELGTPLSNTSYHVRQLAALGFVELVRRTARRGAIEHHYRAKVRPTITDAGWARLPEVVKRAVDDGLLQQTIRHVVTAADAGGFNRGNTHHSRTAGRVDEKGWSTIARDLARLLKRIEKVVEDSEERLAQAPHTPAIEMTVLLMLFEGPDGARGESKADEQHGAAPDRYGSQARPGFGPLTD
ncbi:MAG TPA: winged helix-turn-helix domain-containing protein [Thermoleophilaceae bacterium]